MDDFLLRALLGGIGVALIAGPLGCFLVWRRMAFFGAALSHSALLGVALGFLIGIDLTLGVLVFCLAFALVLVALESKRWLAPDTLLGILSHGMLALGIVLITFIPGLRIDLMAYLFGDILAVGRQDLYLIYALLVGVTVVLAWIWKPLLTLTISEDLAAVDGVPVQRVRLIYVVLMAAVIAVGMKVIGMLLIISLLIIPAATARRMATTPEQMAVGAAVVGVLAVLGGMYGSLEWDLPTGAAIVVAAMFLFLASVLWPGGGTLARSKG
jgi:zinc transport system permease protein